MSVSLTPTPRHRYNLDAGLGRCTACPQGKLSSADRSSCGGESIKAKIHHNPELSTESALHCSLALETVHRILRHPYPASQQPRLSCGDIRQKRAKLRVVPCRNVRARGSGRCVFGLYSRLQDRAQQGRHDVLGVSMRWAVLRHTHPHTTPTPPTSTLPDVMGEPTPNGWPSTVQIVLRVPSAAVHPPHARIAVSNGDFNRAAPFLRPLPRPHLNHVASNTAHCRPS